MNIIVTGGFEANFSVGFARGLKANGVELCVVSCDESASRLTAAGIENLNLRGSLAEDRPFWMKLGNLLGYYTRLLILLLRHRGATVHFTGIFRNQFILWEGLVLNRCFRLLAGRYIYTVHNLLPHGREQSPFFRWIYRRIYHVPDVLLVHTERGRQQLIADFGVPARKIQLTCIGINEEMPVTGMTRSEARYRLGFAEEEQLVLFFGKIDEYKGLDLLLGAFEILPFPKSRLIVAGAFRNPAFRTEIQRQLGQMSRQKDVQFHERFIPNEETELLFKASDVLCLPYRHIYQSGLVFLALRFGIPIVATDVGSLREFVDDEFGIVTLTNDAVGIAAALGQFLAAPGRFSRARILDQAAQYRWDNVCRKLVPLYVTDSSGMTTTAASNPDGEGADKSANAPCPLPENSAPRLPERMLVKKILLISNKVFHYRVSNYNYFASRFREEGWEFCVRANELQKNNPFALEFDFREMPFRFLDYKHEIERLRPDVVILFLHLKNLIIWPLLHWLKFKGIPVVYWNKGINLEVRNPRLRNLPFYYIHSLCDGIVLYSEHEIKDIKPKNRHKVWVANNAVNFTAFPEIHETPAEIKAEFGIPFEKVVLFVGRMRPVKKVEHLIEIFNQIDEPGCGCVIVGDRMDYDLAALIKKDNIRYLGEIFDPGNIQISRLFKMADLFVIPGDVGLGMNQAFYWGLPVVTEDGLQPPEIHYLTNGRSGFIVPENDLTALKEKTLLLLKDDALRAEFSRNAREDILREASVETMFQGFLACVATLLDRTGAHAKRDGATLPVEAAKEPRQMQPNQAAPSSPAATSGSDVRDRDKRIKAAAVRFAEWLERYGETSQDHQDFFASKVGRTAKNLYYKNRVAGTLAVAPMIACEAFAPWTRRFFFPRMRLPIADAHFAMGFAYLHHATGDRRYLDRAIHFLKVLEETRCPGYERHGWGYPFDWQTQHGVLAAGTPLITTTPYCYEAFDAVHRIDGNSQWRAVMHSAAEHALHDYADHETRPGAATCTYTPLGEELVVNASAYRAALLLQAYETFGDVNYREVAERNLAFVLDNQNEDGSWPYAMDGKRSFIDHFHTCFVLKGLAKAERITGDPRLTRSIERGVRYYVDQLFDEDGLPKPFSRRPRLTVYRRELYDCAECLNLGALLRGRFPDLDHAVDRTLDDILENWVQRTGAFRSRKLLVGWDNVPMHRWGQSEIFRSLTQWLARGKVMPAVAQNEPPIVDRVFANSVGSETNSAI